MVEYRINDSAWRKVNDLQKLTYAIATLGQKDTMEIRPICHHENTWVESGIKTCKDCGRQLEVTSFRD